MCIAVLLSRYRQLLRYSRFELLTWANREKGGSAKLDPTISKSFNPMSSGGLVYSGWVCQMASSFWVRRSPSMSVLCMHLFDRVSISGMNVLIPSAMPALVEHNIEGSISQPIPSKLLRSLCTTRI